MGFHEVQLPTDISYGAQFGPEFSTDIVKVGSGFEQRNANWSEALCSGDVGFGVRTLDQVQRLTAFFRARRGRAFGFRFKDWADYVATDSVLGTGDGVKYQWQLVKKYLDSGGYVSTRTITKPVLNTLTVYHDGDVDETGWSADYTTGVITYENATQVTGRNIGTGNGANTQFQLTYPYTYHGQNKEETVYTPVEGSVHVYVDGTETVGSWTQSTGLVAFYGSRQLTNQNLGTGNGSQVNFQLRHEYATGSYREIKTPILTGSTTTIYSNGVLVAANLYTLTESTGGVTFITAPVAGAILTANMTINDIPLAGVMVTADFQYNQCPRAGAVVSASFEFDVPVRFDIDRLPLTLDNYGIYSVTGITIVELKVKGLV